LIALGGGVFRAKWCAGFGEADVKVLL
jgi:hypothetical protein